MRRVYEIMRTLKPLRSLNSVNKGGIGRFSWEPKNQPGFGIGSILSLILTVGVLLLPTGCTKRELRSRLMDLVKIETIDRGEVTARRVQEIKKALAQAEEELERSLQAAVKTADYYRSLALAYMAQEMFPLALEALKSALEFYPTSPSLHYFAGVCSAQMARGRIDPAERARLWTEAEYYYRLALTFKPQYGEAAYALGVLYHFELGRSADAETQLAALLGYQDDNPAALFLMAQVKVSLGKPEEALGCYDRILAVSQDETVRQNALANRDRLLRGQNG